MAVLFISAELEEVLRLSHRIAVLRDRRMVADLANDDAHRRRPAVPHRERQREHERVTGMHRDSAPRPPAVLAGRAAASCCSSINADRRARASSRSRSQDGHLFGSLIDILRNGAPTLIVALGMTLVIATRGIDLSVGAVWRSPAPWPARSSSARPTRTTRRRRSSPPCVARCWSALVLGVWNGFLVAVVGIQPIIATLILMTAGRGIAMLITEGQIITVNSAALQGRSAPASCSGSRSRSSSPR